jgi:tetratricopeptide (TPR) repeat protein
MNNRVTDNSGNDINQQVKHSGSASKTIFQEKLENNNHSNKKLIYSLFIFLILILVGVVFVLPNFINQANQRNQINPIEELNNLEIDRGSQSASKPIAQALISELLVKTDDLKTNGVLFWGGDSWLNVMELYEMGDQSYTSGAFDDAVNYYRQAMDLLVDLEISIPQILTQTLMLANNAFEKGDQEAAIKQYEIALTIDGSNQDARKGYQRSLKLDKVIEYIRLGKEFASQSNWLKAIEAYENAILVDPDYQEALSGFKFSNDSYLEQQFQDLLSNGYSFMSEADFENANLSFQEAKTIYPQSLDVLQAIEVLELNQRLAEISLIQKEATIATINEMWDLAKVLYEEILILDPNIIEIKKNLQIVNERINLALDLMLYISSVDKLYDDQLYNQAIATLNKAQGVQNKGPKLEKQINDLSKVLEFASIPLETIFISDGMTQITIYKLAEFGSFYEKTISLRPGKYTAIGTRSGYRDVILKFRVEKVGQQFMIQCKEKI